MDVEQQLEAGMLWYHWIGAVAGSGVGLGFIAWIIKRFIIRADELEDDHEARQNQRIKKAEERLDNIDKRLQDLDRLEGRLVTRDKVDEMITTAKLERDKLIEDEKQLREARDVAQDKRLERLEKRVLNHGL